MFSYLERIWILLTKYNIAYCLKLKFDCQKFMSDHSASIFLAYCIKYSRGKHSNTKDCLKLRTPLPETLSSSRS